MVASCSRRTRSTVAPQALLMMNNADVLLQAKYFAQRVMLEAGHEPEARIDRAFELALARLPSATEKRAALDFNRRRPDGTGGSVPNAVQLERVRLPAVAPRRGFTCRSSRIRTRPARSPPDRPRPAIRPPRNCRQPVGRRGLRGAHDIGRGAVIDERHAQLSAIAGVDRPRTVEQGDAVLPRHAAARANLAFVTGRYLNRDSGADAGPASRRDFGGFDRMQIHARVFCRTVRRRRDAGGVIELRKAQSQTSGRHESKQC